MTKVHTQSVEEQLRHCPAVADAIFDGVGRPTTFVLVDMERTVEIAGHDLDPAPSDYPSIREANDLDALRPVVEAVNAKNNKAVEIRKELVCCTDRERLVQRNMKDLVHRAATLQL